MKDSRNVEIRILKLLLCGFNSYNQNNITSLVGLDPIKSTHRVQVSRAITNLSKYLERKRNDLDELGKRWALKKNIEIIKEISEKYPEILEILRYDNIVCKMVYQKHVDLISEFYQHIEGNFNTDKHLEWNFLYQLNQSPSFFKYWLQNDSSTLDQIFSDLYNKTQRYIITDDQIKHPRILETCFRACVISDRVNGYVELSSTDIEKMFESPFI